MGADDGVEVETGIAPTEPLFIESSSCDATTLIPSLKDESNTHARDATRNKSKVNWIW